MLNEFDPSETIDIPWMLPTLYWITGVAFGYIFHVLYGRALRRTAEEAAKRTIEHAKQDAALIVREAEVRSRDESLKRSEELEVEIRRHRAELMQVEQRIAEHEAAADTRLKTLDEQGRLLDTRMADLHQREEQIVLRQREVDAVVAEQRKQLQVIGGISAEDARRQLLERIEGELQVETARLVQRSQAEAAARAERNARDILATSIMRYAAPQTSEATTTALRLADDDMKGRLIGREGRNIRSLEATLGVNLIIDDTPQVVVISSFDPMRREVARLTIERLLADGRVQPSRIEEIAAQVAAELDDITRKAGEQAALELGIVNLPAEVVALVGRLKFRTSYGQNLLRHSVEMGHIMGMIASEMGQDQTIARRVGLLHDIGKALTHETGGSHAKAGADFLRKHGESAIVCNAVASHHEEANAESVFAVIARAADAITASRPGARMESTELYINRLGKLEEIARSFAGVSKCFALEAGREVRVIVEPAKIDDNAALLLARAISKRIEENLEYPGQIKVTVVRETRCIEFAR